LLLEVRHTYGMKELRRINAKQLQECGSGLFCDIIN